MARFRRIEWRVNRNEYERILNNAQAQGHATLSSYLRELTLKNDLFIQQTVKETNDNVKKILEFIKEAHQDGQTQKKRSGGAF
ncbi:hypothetical protein COY27_06785 [Candidatus Woesearchaeota archaeon CG_4_10_14_0_2_um_filter_33_13]|nr:MAG: hypothetical protein COY27_06785 [Candidatus Woesearchaeota archaeon CG_4_10_14_0_2_um_filter_33_13]